MLSTRHAIIAGAVALTLAMPAAGSAQTQAPANTRDSQARVSDGVGAHDRHAAENLQPAPYVYSGGHDRHAGETARRQVVNAAVTPPSNPGSDTMDWSDAGIGAIAAFGLVLALAGLTLLAHHHRRRGHAA